MPRAQVKGAPSGAIEVRQPARAATERNRLGDAGRAWLVALVVVETAGGFEIPRAGASASRKAVHQVRELVARGRDLGGRDVVHASVDVHAAGVHGRAGRVAQPGVGGAVRIVAPPAER